MFKLNERYVFDWKRIRCADSYHIEYAITDICNRNCMACSHLAPLARHNNFVSVEEFRRVIKIIRKCIPDAHTVWLTGGEPTLHPEFIELLNIVRWVYPDRFVGIYSNGLTLKNYDEDKRFWDFVRNNGIVWGITTYDSDKSYFERLFSKNHCLNNLAILQSGRLFFNLTNYSQGQPVTQEKYEKCGWEKSKINIRDGKIFNCPSSEFADLFNGYFGAKLKISPEDYLIIDDNLMRAQIDNFKKPIPFCSQCDISQRYKKVYKNVLSKRTADEWTAH